MHVTPDNLTVCYERFSLMSTYERKEPEVIKEQLENGTLADQPCWSFIRDLNSCSDERLNSIAIRDGYRTYTYRQMFYHWEQYARAFAGLGLSGGNHSRVALISTPLTESIFAFYGLNMAGASVSLIYHFDMYDENQIYSMIRKEKITDLVVSELFAFPLLMKRLLSDSAMLGLRNIIVLQSPMGGDYAFPALEIIRTMNKEQFRELSGGYLMEELLQKYEAFPLNCEDEDQTDIILHTTGTVSGMHKPVPMTDRAMNAFVISAIKAKETYEEFKNVPEHMITYLTLNMAWVYAMVDMLHTPLGLGMEIVSLPVGATNPRYAEAIQHYGINVLFTSRAILDSWLKTMPDIDLTKLKVVFMGGTYVSPEYKRRFNDYLSSCGSTARIINGYGLSEMGGACTLAPSSREDDAIGYLLPGFNAKIYVEDEDRYYDISDGPRTGVLLLNSPTMSLGRFGDTVFYELEHIDGRDYFNTNDMMRVNEDGSLTCIGRSNKYFVNNAGVRFDAGLIETSITSQPGISACGLSPEYHKVLHDNIPVLYVEMNEKGPGSPMALRQILLQAFIEEGVIADTNLPSQVVITDRIPLNSSGKVDGKKLATGTVKGARFSVKPVKANDKLIDILLVPAAAGEEATMGAGMPEELENDPYNILSEVFAVIPDITEGRFAKVFKIPGLRELLLKLTGFDIHNIPSSLWNMAPKMYKMAYRKFMPIMKGVKSMSNKNGNNMWGFMPMMPPMMPPMMTPMMPFGMGQSAAKEAGSNMMDYINSGMNSFWDQMYEMQKTSMNAAKAQWNQAFEQMLDMEDSFAASISRSIPSIPGLPVDFFKPEELVEWLKNLQEMFNRHLTEGSDFFMDSFGEKQRLIIQAINAYHDKAQERMNSGEKKEAPKAEAKPAKAAAPKAAPKAARKAAPKAAPKAATRKAAAPKAAENKEDAANTAE